MSKKFHFLVLSWFLLLPLVLAAAEDSDDLIAQAMQSIETGDYSDAKALYLKAAGLGSARAQFELAEAYRSGLFGEVVSPNLVNKWIKTAAKNNYPAAQRRLGESYLSGYGTRPNPKTAAKWFTRAAKQGDPQALQNLGVLYFNGLGVTQSDAKAFSYWQAAAEAGNDKAKANLAFMYFQGRGTSASPEQGAAQLLQLAEDGDVQAQRHVGRLYAEGLGLPQDWTQSVNWYTRAADQQDVESMKILEELYRQGVWVEKNDDKADTWAGRRELLEWEPIALSKTMPKYPGAARRNGIQGWVVVEFTITELGDVADLRVLDSYPKDVFDDASMEAVSQFKYQPRIVAGEPVTTHGIKHQISYELEGYGYANGNIPDGPWYFRPTPPPTQASHIPSASRAPTH